MKRQKKSGLKSGLTGKALKILEESGAISRRDGRGKGAGAERRRPPGAGGTTRPGPGGARSARPTRKERKDEEFLARLALVWKNRAWVAESLRQIRLETKKGDVIKELEMTKPERHVLSRYQKAAERLSKEEVTQELVWYYKLPMRKADGIVKRMRARAYMRKYRGKAAPGAK